MPHDPDFDVVLAPAEVDVLLSKLCVKLGFCLPPKECERFRTSPPTDVREFANQVFRAEGLEPERADTQLGVRLGISWRKHLKVTSDPKT